MADAGKLKDINTDALRRALQGKSGVSKNQLARQTGLSFPTVSRTIDALVEAGELAEAGVDRATGGRSAKLYTVNPLHRVALLVRLESGILRWFANDLAGNRLLAGEANAKGAALQTLENAIAQVRGEYPQLGAVVLGLDGAVHDGMVTEAFGHDELKGFHLRRQLQEATGLPVAVENDMSVVSMGYAARCAGEVSSVVCLYLGSLCPGAGVVLNGEVWHGATGFAGELFYLPGQALPVNGQKYTAAGVLQLYAHMVCAYATLLNPERMVLYHNEYIAGGMDELRTLCAKALPAHALPQITLSSEFSLDYEAGLWARAQKLML